MKLKITDAAGREVREISGTSLANSNKAGIQSACWDLRVQPAPAPGGAGVRAVAQGGGRCRQGAQGGRRARRRHESVRRRLRRRGGGGGGGGFGGGGGGNPGPYRARRHLQRRARRRRQDVDTKPLRVNDDPEVVLTAVERKQLFDMAMEMHALQRRATEAATGVALAQPAGRRADDRRSAAKTDVPADVKSVVRGAEEGLAALRRSCAGGGGGGRGGGGGGGRGGNESLDRQDRRRRRTA